MLLSVLLALMMVPVMLTLGSVTYADLAEDSAHQASTRHETVAVLTHDAPAVTFGAGGEIVSGKSDVRARWRLPDGTVRTGLVPAEDGMRAGTEVPVWLDESGNSVDPPMSTADAAAVGVLVAVGGWAAVAGMLALACWGLHHTLDRRRHRAWTAEWAKVEPDWHDRRR